MSQPLSRAETLAVFDELAELGVMTPAMQSEARDCITLAPPAASATLGMTGAMMKNMVLPQLRSAREEMANLAPEEREQLATEIAQAMKDLPPEDRKAFQEGFGAGFFPPEVVTAVKDKLR
jgi:glutamine synthetase adenylyltransferase